MACFLADIMIIAPLIGKPKDGSKKYTPMFIFYIKESTFKLHPRPARYTELGTHPYLENLSLFVSQPNAVSLGGGWAYENG